LAFKPERNGEYANLKLSMHRFFMSRPRPEALVLGAISRRLVGLGYTIKEPYRSEAGNTAVYERRNDPYSHNLSFTCTCRKGRRPVDASISLSVNNCVSYRGDRFDLNPSINLLFRRRPLLRRLFRRLPSDIETYDGIVYFGSPYSDIVDTVGDMRIVIVDDMRIERHGSIKLKNFASVAAELALAIVAHVRYLQETEPTVEGVETT
jgi:hypothetical protein